MRRRRYGAGELWPAIDSVFALEDARAAFARVSEHGKRGKIVLSTGTLEEPSSDR